MIEIGRICTKIAGRDAGLACVIVDVDQDGKALIDGETRRRKCNPRHLVATAQKVEIAKGASHEEVLAALKEIGITGRTTKPKREEKKPGRVKRKEKKQEKPVKEAGKEGKSVTKREQEEKPAEKKPSEKKKPADKLGAEGKE